MPGLRNTARISGWGLVTPLGGDGDAAWRVMLGGGAIGDHSLALGYSGLGRALAMADAAAREAIAHAGWAKEILADLGTALIVGTSKGAVTDWLSPGAFVDSRGFASLDCELGHSLGIGGSRLTLGAACASGCHALGRAALMLACGEAKRAVVVAVEASVHPLFVGSFGRLGVLSRCGVCRPMDRRRDGFLLSEAAAAICVESAPTASGDIVIDRWAMGADASHLTASDPTGAATERLLRQVIGRGSFDSDAIDMVHAHATGTPMNDATELAAIDRVLGEYAASKTCAFSYGRESPLGDLQRHELARPLVYSHKAALGHSLGASGLVAVAINCMCHRNDIVPGNIHTTEPLDATHVMIDAGIKRRPIRRSIVLAAGFGGATAAVALRKLA
jgi:3-oxoacyl-[acyl-carrier-protein] synthase II